MNDNKRKKRKSDKPLISEEELLLQNEALRSCKGEQEGITSNLLERKFKATALNQKWATDITQFNGFGQKLYLSPIIDLFNQEIISYELTWQPIFNQVLMMLNKAFMKIPDNTNLILHSNQGWQYQMKRYQIQLKEKGIIQSTSRKGNCLDNAIIKKNFRNIKIRIFLSEKIHLNRPIKKGN